jgi:23S rRNA (cytosine1962-C5)-methyltransferase
MTRVILKPGEEDRVLAGHPWVYDNEIDRVEGEALPGDVVDVESSRKTYLGRGFINPASKIRVRLLCRGKEGIDEGYFKRTLREAFEYRGRYYDTDKDSFRLAFAEADFLPGLIADVYVGRPAGADRGEAPGKYAVVQALSYGMDRRRDWINSSLVELLAPRAIIERNDAPVRELEGLVRETRVSFGSTPGEIEIAENGIAALVDPIGGQKTGYFLDQKENRAALAPYAPGAAVLDAFCHTGSFALHAARYGARSVIAADISEAAIALAARNAALNGYADRIETVAANAFDLLRAYERQKRKFGLIILDPPAFAKSRETTASAYRGYKEINLRALSLLEKGGFLVSCSCSYHVGTAEFLAIIGEAARDAGRRLRIVELRSQSRDHPVLAGYDESRYLKCVIAQVAR